MPGIFNSHGMDTLHLVVRKKGMYAGAGNILHGLSHRSCCQDPRIMNTTLAHTIPTGHMDALLRRYRRMGFRVGILSQYKRRMRTAVGAKPAGMSCRHLDGT